MSKLKPSVDLGYPTEPHGRVPSFSNIEEEAEFWDTHDFMDFEGEFKPAEGIVDPRFAVQLILELETADRKTLWRIAQVRGVNPLTLAQTWLEERLVEEASAEVGSR